MRNPVTTVCHPQRECLTVSEICSPCLQTVSRTGVDKDFEHPWGLVADIRTDNDKCYYLASVITRKIKFESMTPAHCPHPVRGNSLENLIDLRAG